MSFNKQSIFVGDIFPSNLCGLMEVIEYTSSKNVLVKFQDTGTIKRTQAHHIRIGNVKDNYYPIIENRGYVGDGKVIRKIYNIWRAMMYRCYNPSDKAFKWYGAKGVYVANVWFNFQTYQQWYLANVGKGMEVDKDILSGKVYSPDTCCAVSRSDNLKAAAKIFKFRSPEGVPFVVVNLRQFCKANHLDDGCMYKVIKGKRNKHKGWTKL